MHLVQSTSKSLPWQQLHSTDAPMLTAMNNVQIPNICSPLVHRITGCLRKNVKYFFLSSCQMNLAQCAAPKVHVTCVEAFSDKTHCLQDDFSQWCQNQKLHWPHQRTPSWEIKMLNKPWQSELQVLKNVPSKHLSQVDFSLCHTNCNYK